MRRSLLLLVALLALAVPAAAQITIPYPTFVAGTVIDPDQMNLNNSTLAAQALNRTGGTVTGAITSSGGSLTGSWAGGPTMTGAWVFSGTPTISGTLTSSGGTFSGTWAGSPTMSGGWTFSSTTTHADDIILSAKKAIRTNTSDGSDNLHAGIAGGGTIESSALGARGAGALWYGNEDVADGVAGSAINYIGNVAGAVFGVYGNGGTRWLNLLGANGAFVSQSSVSQTTGGPSGNVFEFQSTHASDPGGIKITYTAAAPNGTGNNFISGSDTGASRFQLRSNGGLANFSANNVNLSDARTKDIIGRAPSQRALFRRIQFVQARYKDAPASPLDVMVTAQQLQQIYPDLVTMFDPEHGLLGVREQALMMRALKVVQEQDAVLVGLERRLRALEAK